MTQTLKSETRDLIAEAQAVRQFTRRSAHPHRTGFPQTLPTLMNSRLILSKSISSVLALGALGLFANAQTTRIWDGGDGTNDLSAPLNWSGDTIPTVLGDTALWDGTVSDPLTLLYNDAAYAGVPGNVGLNVSLTGTQTS